ncbi:hypothetical protein GCM10023322_48770 [Rugosimonospora acidiphila]|uniref:Uncharacterized protein n=1 Tax=Rugosimonospora acidiphila TaxID=556531 RepID=A0ABP9S7N7_9ACTN
MDDDAAAPPLITTRTTAKTIETKQKVSGIAATEPCSDFGRRGSARDGPFPLNRTGPMRRARPRLTGVGATHRARLCRYWEPPERLG